MKIEVFFLDIKEIIHIFNKIIKNYNMSDFGKPLSMEKKMKYRLNSIYDVLVEYADAPEVFREGFISYHMDDDGYKEWRILGNLGFGGKYRFNRNRVDCYSEDEHLYKGKIDIINKKLKEYDV